MSPRPFPPAIPGLPAVPSAPELERIRAGGARHGRRALVVGVTIAAALLGLVACTPRISVTALDQKLYRTSLPAFAQWWRQEQAAAHHVSVATVDRWLRTDPERLDHPVARTRPFDVSTDLCSMSPNVGPAFDFRLPCIRHDFAWRNLRRLQQRDGGRINTRERRLDATRQFHRDMQTTCAARPFVQRVACTVVAQSYYQAVALIS